jgi:ActR/RegA family two-component response regulator
MGISGSLKDVSVADVMQFIHLGRRTGTLLLHRGAQKAMVGFHYGRLVSAQAPKTPKLGDLLISSGMIDRGILERAISSQKEAAEHRSLGQILVTSGSIDAEGLRQVIAQQIEQAVSEVMVWDNGTFEFAIDDLRPIDDIALYPSDVLPDADINTQMVLLEAARIFDERNRDRAELPLGHYSSEGEGTRGGSYEAGDATNPTLHLSPAARAATMSPGSVSLPEPDLDDTRETPLHAAEVLRLHVVSGDRGFAEKLSTALEHEVASVDLKGLGQAGIHEVGEAHPIVLVDLRGDEVTLEQAASLHRARPKASIIAVVDPAATASLVKVYEAGVLAAVPAEIEAVVACVENVIENRRDLVRGAPRPESRSGVERLRRVYGDLRSGLISATVALNLMHIISESVERAVLFLVKRDHLMAIGAFGTDSRGKPLAESTRTIKVAIEGDGALVRSLESGEVLSLDFEAAELPEALAKILGRPRTGQTVVFPVLGAQRVISIIYTDNGDRDHPIEDIDILELATAQVGMAFENELLRRQISQGRE